MKEVIIDRYTKSAPPYIEYSPRGLFKQCERNCWQSIFTEVIGEENKRVLDVGTSSGEVRFQLTELGHDVMNA